MRSRTHQAAFNSFNSWGGGGGDCATLEEALECLDDLVYEGSLESEPDDEFFVRYGITFTDAGAAEIARRIAPNR
jgi:hypothetical protein